MASTVKRIGKFLEGKQQWPAMTWMLGEGRLRRKMNGGPAPMPPYNRHSRP
ncbi:unnamed protein product [Ciceribacter selenitireducens ATCC BAA-1503]|uniref:Uncharacterized protein n=1 Tax=Ciceribacter selenitireducens ATCC BAA-1503 TaxID=1336235 RepID=A0A376AE83_9HYPH|nr:unnamed protein product [Ciceribacter selenitireducens ATCC BAA-1503]